MNTMDFFTALFTQPVPRDRRNPAISRLAPAFVRGRVKYLEEFEPAPFGAHARRLAKYARYRNSVKGLLRTRRYNASDKHMACNRKYRDEHPRTESSYQNSRGTWVHPVWVPR